MDQDDAGSKALVGGVATSTTEFSLYVIHAMWDSARLVDVVYAYNVCDMFSR
jgi:hypothetical protein